MLRDLAWRFVPHDFLAYSILLVMHHSMQAHMLSGRSDDAGWRKKCWCNAAFL